MNVDEQKLLETTGYRVYDKAFSTRKICLSGLVLAWLVCLGGLVSISAILGTQRNNIGSDGELSTPLRGRGATLILPLLFAIIVTFCNECLGLIHTTSLRWALWQEGRLVFNTNLRLLSQAQTSKPNTWYMNAICMFLTAISYAAAGQIVLVRNPASSSSAILIDVPSIAFLAFGLSGQAMIATWTVRAMKQQMLTWSANSLNNSLLCYQHGLERQDGQSLTSYRMSQVIEVSTPSMPQSRQVSLSTARPSTTLITGLLWLVVVITFTWAGVISHVGYDLVGGSSGLHRGQAITFSANAEALKQPAYIITFIGIAFSLATQLMYTFTLHCTELLVNASRDERTWRRASNLKGKGAEIDRSAIKEACSSWETVSLFTLKTGIHWAFGEAVKITFRNGRAVFAMWANSLFVLAVMMVIVAIFGTYLCFRRPSGPQPTTYGHINTLINLVDDFGAYGEPLFWGDKGHIMWQGGDEVRHAGTAGSPEKLGSIRMHAKYS